jgi:hypothetical protein
MGMGHPVNSHSSTKMHFITVVSRSRIKEDRGVQQRSIMTETNFGETVLVSMILSSQTFD